MVYRMSSPWALLRFFSMLLLALHLPGFAQKHKPSAPVTLHGAMQKASADGSAEASLLEVYALAAKGQSRIALEKVSKIVQEHPNFQLAQLVYGDLLAARIRPVSTLGDVPTDIAKAAAETLGELRDESQKRVSASKERPRAGLIPSQFLQISQKTRYAIAVDASRARLYLFENRPGGLTLVSDYYISVGKAGVAKNAQGDQRTPLGVYYVTSNLDPKSLKDFYGSGALPINYPNMLDAKRGKTGGGIWLHGTPPNQFSRAPLATDGCLVMANPDLSHIMRTIEIGSTPVVIAPQLQWVDPNKIKQESQPFEDTLQAWANAKIEGNLDRLLSFYAPDFNAYGKTRDQWAVNLKAELSKVQGHGVEIKDKSFLRWTDSADTMVVTFGEVVIGKRTGWTKRQYWNRQGGQWKIFFEGIL
jgi:murein L,D-transpeptidase YafK